MSDIESLILSHLSTSPSARIADTLQWSASSNLEHNLVIGAVKSLSVEAYVSATELKTEHYSMSSEAEDIIANGSQEFAVVSALMESGAGGMSIPELMGAVGKDVYKIGFGKCMKNKWAKKTGDTLIALKVKGDVTDETRDHLNALKQVNGDVTATADADVVLDDAAITALKRRKLITLVTQHYLAVSRGKDYAPKRQKRAADLTKEMLDSGDWTTTPFKPYNFATVGEKVGGGYLHPLLKVRAEFRKILMQMGFQEMPTNKWVESSFWNFDTLFQPQSHPARDAHDTFFIKEPASTVSVPEEYYERVKAMHEVGGAGSIGYRYDFKREEAFKNLLRTHTTAISSQMLYRLANQKGGFTPKKYFSIDRVFRNETMDATHLCEFHQVEGLVADYDLSLGDLIGTIETFFNKIGITQLRFKPAFNPYTEPSMEIFGYHPDLKQWTEIGNSGMFRPEMLAPMGLPKNVRVIAWGLSLERPTMIKYRIKNIRDLFGHKVEMARTRTAPICRFDAVA